MCKNKAGTRANRFEYKTADATANPFMALGAFIAAGLDGLRRNLKLPAEVAIDPALIPEDQRIAKGIDLLPQNLNQALLAARDFFENFTPTSWQDGVPPDVDVGNLHYWHARLAEFNEGTNWYQCTIPEIASYWEDKY